MTPGGNVWAVVVARTGPTAKSRLAGVLTPAQRADLARAMLADVLAACDQAPLAGCVLVAAGADAAQLGQSHASVVVEDPGRGMNAAIQAGIWAAGEQDADAVLVLPSDLPLLRADALKHMLDLAAAGRRVAVIAADRRDDGTNALLLRPPHLIVPRFGGPSARRHAEAAARAGADVELVVDSRLGFDLDTPGDLADVAPAACGPATRAALERLGLAAESAPAIASC